MDVSKQPQADLELFDPISTCDRVFISLFQNINAPEATLARVFRLILQKLWCSDKLAHPTNDITARLAALDLAAGGLPFGIDVTKHDFSKHTNNWEKRTGSCSVRIKEICHENPKLLNHVCRYLEDRITELQPSFSPEPRKSLTELVICLYSAEADRLASQNDVAKLVHDPNEEFQIEIVTFLKFCGGEPATIQTVNIPNTLDWSFFQQFLSTATTNWQSAMLGYPDGFSLAKGAWLYQIVKGGELQPNYHKLLGDDQYGNLMTGMLLDPEKKNEIPRLIHVKQYLVAKTLKDKERRFRDDPGFGFGGMDDNHDESGYSYIRLPPGFMPAIHSSVENTQKTAAKLEKVKAADAEKKAKADARRAADRLEQKKQRRRNYTKKKEAKHIADKYGPQRTGAKQPEESGDEMEDEDGSEDDLFVAPAIDSVTTTLKAPSKQPALRRFPTIRPRRSLILRPAAPISAESRAALQSASKPTFSYDKYRSVEDEVPDEEGSDEE